MACRKALVRDGGSGSLGKALSSRCNCSYEFKRISIGEIQPTYIVVCDRLSMTDTCLIVPVTDRSVAIVICPAASVTSRSIATASCYAKSVSHLTRTTVIGRYK